MSYTGIACNTDTCTLLHRSQTLNNESIKTSEKKSIFLPHEFKYGVSAENKDSGNEQQDKIIAYS
jgi:hypothetical protein